MFLTRTADDLKQRTAATAGRPARRANLRVWWTVRDGRLLARWQRESRDPAEGGARAINCVTV